jgi:hypothetical protein
MLSLALAGSPHHLILPHGIPRLASGATSCLFSTHARISWRQTKVCLLPLICFGQTRASRPPPLQHRVPTRAALKIRSLELSASVSLIRIAPGLFHSVTGQPALGTGARPGLTTGPFQPRGILDVRMSLSTFFVLCRRRAAAILRYGRNPCVIQADSEPPGRHPPAPGSHIRRSAPSPGDLSLAQVWWGFPRLSSIPAPSLSSSRNP